MGTIPTNTDKSRKHLARALQKLTGDSYTDCLKAVTATDDTAVIKHLAEADKDATLNGQLEIPYAQISRIVGDLIDATDGYQVLHAYQRHTHATGVMMHLDDAETTWHEVQELREDDGLAPLEWSEKVAEEITSTWAWSKGMSSSDSIMERMWDLIDDACNDVDKHLRSEA